MAIFHTKPMLYDCNEIKPSTPMSKVCKNAGYGYIDRIIDSNITQSAEEYTLVMTVDNTSKVSGALLKMNLILANGQLFRIEEVVYNSEEDVKEVFARHISFDNRFDVVVNKKYTSKTFEYILKDMSKLSQFKQFNIKTNMGRLASRTLKEAEFSDGSIDAEIEALIDEFKDDCARDGIDIDIEITRDNYDVGYYLYEANKDYTTSTYKNSKGSGVDTGIRLDYKKIKSLEITDSTEDFCTSVTIKGKDNVVVYDVTNSSIGNAGYPFWIKTVISDNETADKTKLTKIARAHIALKSLSIKNIRVEMEELPRSLQELYKDVKLYDKVLVKHNMIADTWVPFRIVKTERDINGNLKTIELGELNSEFAKSLKKAITRTAQNVVNKTLKTATV